MNDSFSNYIGQDGAIRLLRFQTQSYRETGYFAPILINSKRGNGKSYLSELIGKELKKPRLCLNASTIKNATSFVEQIFIPHCLDKNITLHFDESHSIKKSNKLEDLLLSALSPNKNHINLVDFEGSQLVFDNRKISWIFSTTNIEQHSPALRNRLKPICLDEYSPNELVKILRLNLDKSINIDNQVLNEIISVSRETARNCVILAEDLNGYCKVNKITSFTKDHWQNFKHIFSIRTLGLTNDEINVLKLLSKHSKITLTGLASALEQDRKTIQHAVEPFLLKKALIGIDVGGRKITAKGAELIKEL